MSNQLGAQFGYSLIGPENQFTVTLGQSVLDGSSRFMVTQPGSLRLGQSLYVIIRVNNLGPVDQQVWIMPWWLHPTSEFRYPGENGYTAEDAALFGPQLPIATQDTLWMTSPKRLDIVGAPAPSGSSISDMQSDIWAVDVPANTIVKKSFFYPSHGYGLALTRQLYNEEGISDFTCDVNVTVTPGALHAVFQDGQG